MPRNARIPSYCRHKGRNLAYVTIDGREIYLGTYDSPESKEKYARIIAEQFPTGQQNESTGRPDPRASSLTINELILAYWTGFVETTYVSDGKPSERQYHVRQAMRPLKSLYGSTVANESGPRSLKAVRDRMIEVGVNRRGGLNRKYINDHVGIIKRMFRWAVSDELVDVRVYEALNTVENIRKGRDDRVKEGKKVLPAPEADVEAVLKQVSPPIGAMIQIQRITGMRPDEVTIMRPSDIDRSGDVWIYTPGSHKMDYQGIEKLIPLGPQVQKVIRPWLERKPSAYCFSPREVVAARRRGASQSEPVRCDTARSPRERYDDDSYRQAVERACTRAGVNKWTPGQLRHNAATKLRHEFGIEAARLILGHQSASTTEIYAEKNFEEAIRIVKEVG